MPGQSDVLHVMMFAQQIFLIAKDLLLFLSLFRRGRPLGLVSALHSRQPQFTDRQAQSDEQTGREDNRAGRTPPHPLA